VNERAPLDRTPLDRAPGNPEPGPTPGIENRPLGGGPALLRVDRLSKTYGRVLALAEVSLAVASGERVVLLGPNGAGKTTLFQILSGLFAPDRGRIEIDGHDIAREPAAALARLGLVFQPPTLDLDLSVRANLVFHARLHGLGRARRERRIAEALERFGIDEHARTPCRRLSGGTRRKVELARALLPEPRLLLLDEPTAGLDPASRRALIEHVQALCHDQVRDGERGALWATHLVDEAERADRVLVLHRGRVVASGTPAELVAATGAGTLGDAFFALTRARDGDDAGGDAP